MESFPLLALARWSSDPTVTGTYVGVETVNGTAVNHITITRVPPVAVAPDFQQTYQAITQCELYVSTQSNLPVRIRYYAHPVDWQIPVPKDVDFSNYTQVSGLLFPATVVESHNGQPTRQLDFQTITVHAAVSRLDSGSRVAFGGGER